MKILIAGPQGSGKTTQAQILAKKLNLCFISLGDSLRELAEQNTDEGNSARKSLEEGTLVDDKIAVEVFRREIEKEHCQQGFVADGFPRHLKQLKYFDPMFDKVVYLDVSDEEVIKRLLSRGREDDTPELIKERLGIYHTETEPVLGFYENQGKLVRIEASQLLGMSDAQSIEKIAAEIEEKVKR